LRPIAAGGGLASASEIAARHTRIRVLQPYFGHVRKAVSRADIEIAGIGTPCNPIVRET